MKLYKYLHPDRIDILENGLMRFTQPAAFNDPFEMNPHIEAIATEEYIERQFAQTHEGHVLKRYNKQPLSFRLRTSFKTYQEHFGPAELLRKIKEKLGGEALTKVRESIPIAINDAVGVLCLTETSDNLLMWAHYADSHSGMVFEFDADHDFFARQLQKAKGLTPIGLDADLRKEYGFLRKVQYSIERPKVMIADVTSFDSFLTKSHEWEYEQEWRVLMPLAYVDQKLDDAGDIPIFLFKIPLSAITKIVLGQRASASLEDAIKNIVCNNPAAKHLVLERMILDPKEFKVHPTAVLCGCGVPGE